MTVLALCLGSSAAAGWQEGPAEIGGHASPLVGEAACDGPTFDHEAVVRSARLDAFYRAWDAADGETRLAVAGTMDSLRSPGAPAEWWPDLGIIEVATRQLGGLDPEALLAENKAAALAVQAAALDLRVLPGAFEAKREGRTASLVVRVAPLFELREALEVELSLIWVGPDGQEIPSRKEQVAAKAFTAPGFDMYVRAPNTGPGLWTLVAELALPAGSAAELAGPKRLQPVRGHGVVVPAMENPDGQAVLLRLLAQEFERGVTGGLETVPIDILKRDVQRKLQAHELLRNDGLRLAPFWSAGDQGFPGYWNDAQAGSGIPGADHLTGSYRYTSEGRYPRGELSASVTGRNFVRVAPLSQIGADLDGGLFMQRWTQLGEVLDVTASRDGVDPAIGRALDTCAPKSPGPPGSAVPDGRVLILRGTSLIASQLEAIRHGLAGVDYIVIVARGWRPTPIFPKVPTLFISPNQSALDTAGTAEHVTARFLSDSVFLSDLEIPGIIIAWLEELDRKAAIGGAK